MEYHYRRPGHRPGKRHRRRGTTILCLLGLLIGLIYLRSSLNLEIYEATMELGRYKSSVLELERQVDGLQVEIDRSTDIARLEPRARRLGLAPPTPVCVSLLPASSVSVSGARPLPGAGALGRLVQRAAALARVAGAAAADESPAAAGGQAAAPRASCAAKSQCKFCR